jgi:ligand-binding SRPBCC domain-containing protein
MAVLQSETFIRASPQSCFDAARDVGLHCRASAHSKERAVGGKTTGLLELGDTVTFEGVHFGVRQKLTAKITRFEPPRCFEDQMTQGAFKSLRHLHEFSAQNGGTLMRDTMVWESPFGMVGRVFDAVLLKRHMKNFMLRKNAAMKAILEASDEAAATD